MYSTWKKIPSTYILKQLPFDLKSLGLEREQILIISIAGSHMYQTSTPDSDKDYLGVYIPTKRQILLKDFPRQIPVPKESGLDCKIWSIHYFIDLLCNGDTNALDLLHSPYECWLLWNLHVWPWLVTNKRKFYTKTMNSLVGYAMNQANKYGLKGSRMKSLRRVLKFLESIDKDTKLKEIWNNLPHGKHIHFLTEIHPHKNQTYKLYQVCGPKFHDTVRVSYVIDALRNKLTFYGGRAKMAEIDDGVDWKALSHAIRAAEQVHWILKYGGYSYPLKNTHFLKQVKLGNIPFDAVTTALECYIDRINDLIEKSQLPEKIDKEFWNNWLIQVLEEYL